jgi:hypothetical protein
MKLIPLSRLLRRILPPEIYFRYKKTVRTWESVVHPHGRRYKMNGLDDPLRVTTNILYVLNCALHFAALIRGLPEAPVQALAQVRFRLW